MLVAADFDTQGNIRKFAERPTRANRCALRYFLRRVMLRLNWEICSALHGSPDLLAGVMSLRVGAKADMKDAMPAPVNLGDMTEEQRVALYVDWCKAVGVDITADQLMHPEQPTNQ